jgi:hypothetical protein
MPSNQIAGEMGACVPGPGSMGPVPGARFDDSAAQDDLLREARTPLRILKHAVVRIIEQGCAWRGDRMKMIEQEERGSRRR